MLRLQKIKKGYYFHSTDDQQILSASKNSRLSPAVVTISGLADPKKDLWAEASFSGIRNFAICEVISQALSPPVYCNNDCQAFALAKMVFGACRDVKDFLYVNVSNSIGGAVVAGGKLVYGARGNAGEFGHCIVMPGCRPCKCGSNGCLKMYASGLGIAHTYQEAGRAPQTDGKPFQGKHMAERARGGEKLAQRVFEAQEKMICSVIATAANLLNPRKVILGGGKICCGAEASLATLIRSYERIEDLHLILLHMFVCWFKANQDKLEG